MPPAVCVPAATLRAVPLARFTAVLLKVAIEPVAPLKLAVPPLAVVMLAGPATLIVPPDKVGMVAPAEKLVVPVPLRVPSVIVPVALVKLTLPELASGPSVKLA